MLVWHRCIPKDARKPIKYVNKVGPMLNNLDREATRESGE